MKIVFKILANYEEKFALAHKGLMTLAFVTICILLCGLISKSYSEKNQDFQNIRRHLKPSKHDIFITS